MHHIYHTRGLILGSVPTGEANRFYLIFTEDLGLVGATAQAVRETKSKLRYSLQDFSWANLDFVRGKEVWRIASAQGIWNGKFEVWDGELDMGHPLSASSFNFQFPIPNSILFARVCALVSRLVHGEGRHDGLFGEILAINEFLQREKLTTAQKTSFETLTALRILAHLGYFDPNGYRAFIAGDISRELLDRFENVRADAVSRINEALRASHL